MKLSTFLFLILISFSACQKRKGGEATASSSEAAQPQGGETTEGGGGTDQLESYLKSKNSFLNSDIRYSNKPYIFDFSRRSEDIKNTQTVMRFYNIAEILNTAQKEYHVRFLARAHLKNLLTKDVPRKDLIQKAHDLTTDTNVRFIWYQNLYDQKNRPAWSLNSPTKLRIRMNFEMWIGKRGVNERLRLCNDILIPYYNQSPFFCFYTVDSIISTHEFLSLVGIEKDNDFHLSTAVY